MAGRPSPRACSQPPPPHRVAPSRHSSLYSIRSTFLVRRSHSVWRSARLPTVSLVPLPPLHHTRSLSLLTRSLPQGSRSSLTRSPPPETRSPSLSFSDSPFNPLGPLARNPLFCSPYTYLFRLSFNSRCLRFLFLYRRCLSVTESSVRVLYRKYRAGARGSAHRHRPKNRYRVRVIDMGPTAVSRMSVPTR